MIKPPEERELMRVEARYLAVPDAADYLGVSVRFIRRLVAERRIAFHKAGARVLFAIADLDEFMFAGRVEPITRSSVACDLREIA
jgi:excisionase family DNA binding protein